MKPPSPSFDLGQTVYRKVAASIGGQVTGIMLRPGSCVYLVTWSDDYDERQHYALELTTERGFEASGFGD